MTNGQGWGNPDFGGTALRRAAMRSPNYVAGSTGWTINQDGSVEFNNGTFRGTVTASSFVGTDFIINTAGSFFYSGTPAAGNLIASIAPASGTDAFGNNYLQGVCTYTSALFTQMVAGALIFGAVVSGVPDTGHAGNLVSAGNAAFVASPILPSLGLGNGTNLEVLSGASSTHTGGANVPEVLTLSADQSSDVDYLFPGSVRKTSLSGVPYGWQTPSMSTGYTNLTLRYKLDAQDNLVIDGGFTQTTGVTGAGSAQIITALAAPYKSSRQSRIPMAWTSSSGVLKGSGMLVVQTTGEWDIQWPATTANGDRFYCTFAEAPIGQLT